MTETVKGWRNGGERPPFRHFEAVFLQAVMDCGREPREADPESYGRRRMRDKKTGALMFLTFMILIVALILYWLGNRMAGGEPKD